ncbi:hypothetical protein BKA70DRAFT_1227534 [Coprinopsis sp. MPI-PUGE-AT-0042]|nr:hypothetical protein BKA70DRAFT_1227534 [Coprinopsis sp. MPI-PUGE-AT-0042]
MVFGLSDVGWCQGRRTTLLMSKKAILPRFLLAARDSRLAEERSPSSQTRRIHTYFGTSMRRAWWWKEGGMKTYQALLVSIENLGSFLAQACTRAEERITRDSPSVRTPITTPGAGDDIDMRGGHRPEMQSALVLVIGVAFCSVGFIVALWRVWRLLWPSTFHFFRQIPSRFCWCPEALYKVGAVGVECDGVGEALVSLVFEFLAATCELASVGIRQRSLGYRTERVLGETCNIVTAPSPATYIAMNGLEEDVPEFLGARVEGEWTGVGCAVRQGYGVAVITGTTLFSARPSASFQALPSSLQTSALGDYRNLISSVDVYTERDEAQYEYPKESEAARGGWTRHGGRRESYHCAVVIDITLGTAMPSSLKNHHDYRNS